MEKHTKIGIAIVVVILLILAGVGGIAVKNYFAEETAVMSLSEYYQVPDGEALIFMDDKRFEKNALLADGVLYLDLDTVRERFNKRFFVDEDDNSECLVLLTNATELIEFIPGAKEYKINGSVVDSGYPVVAEKNGELYVALDYVTTCSDMKYKAFSANGDSSEEIQRVVIDSDYSTDFLYTKVAKDTQIRVEADRKSKVLANVKKDAVLTLVDAGGTQQSSYLKVMTEDAIVGFVNKNHVTEGFYQKKTSDYVAPAYPSKSLGEKVCLMWHNMENASANDNLGSLLAETEGVNVISPTWLRLADEDGNVTSLADVAYIEKAHEMGIQVWPLVRNFDTGNEVDTHQVLASNRARRNLEQVLVEEVLRIGADGINIDFETLKLDDGPYFVQFLRELSILCRERGLILSVDNYVPEGYNKYYDYAEQGIVADYVVIMAYDEHTSISEEPGSVASIGYVQMAIDNTLAMVPAEKIVIGVPFYTRLWKVVTEGETEKFGIAETPAMGAAQKNAAEHKADVVWDETTAQYYAEYTENEAVYKVWLEEERSIAEKLVRVDAAKLGGMAAWRIGLEKKEVWPVITAYLDGTIVTCLQEMSMEEPVEE